MGLSYRHAWGMIQRMERRCGFKLVKTAVGGKEGGGASLTTQGQELVQRYLALRNNLDEFIKQKFNEEFERKTQKAKAQALKI